MDAVSNPSIIFIGKLSPKINRRDTENTEKNEKNILVHVKKSCHRNWREQRSLFLTAENSVSLKWFVLFSCTSIFVVYKAVRFAVAG